jgi:hypothetical protein
LNLIRRGEESEELSFFSVFFSGCRLLYLPLIQVSIATTSGASILYAVRGDNGADLPHFPIRVASSGQGPVYPPVLLLDLHEATSGLSEVEPSSGLDGGSSSLAPQLRGRSRGSSGSHYGNESNSSLAAQHQQHRKKRSGPAPLGGVASGLHLLFPTHDGGLHVVEGGSGCLNRVELGERVYAMPLADDLQVRVDVPRLTRRDPF